MRFEYLNFHFINSNATRYGVLSCEKRIRHRANQYGYTFCFYSIIIVVGLIKKKLTFSQLINNSNMNKLCCKFKFNSTDRL